MRLLVQQPGDGIAARAQAEIQTVAKVHQFLLHSSCRTENPAEADFFFVPVYAACVMTKERKTAEETWIAQGKVQMNKAHAT